MSLSIGSHDIWFAECPRIRREKGAVTFTGILRRYELLMELWPRRAREVKEALLDEGLPLPFARLVTNRVKSLSAQIGTWLGQREAREATLMSTARWIATVRGVRTTLENELLQYLEQPAPKGGMRRRWFVQQVGYRLSRLLYLTPCSEAKGLLKRVPSGDEFHEQRVVLEALATGESLDLLNFPGAAVNTYCEVVAEQGSMVTPSDWPLLTHRAMGESATMFALYLGWKPPRECREGLTRGSRLLLECFTGERSGEGERQSFIDEVSLLLAGTDSAQRLQYARSRLSPYEVRGLSAMMLGEAYS